MQSRCIQKYMKKRSTEIKDMHGRVICEGDTIENVAIRDTVVFRNGVWTTEHNATGQSIELLLPVEVVDEADEQAA